MFKKIIEESLHTIGENHKIIRLAFLTSFFHSLVVIAMILYNINNILHYRFASGVDYETLFGLIQGNISILIVIIIIAAIGYELMYPIGQASIIQYIHKPNSISKAINKGLSSFFVMFEYNNLMLTFGSMTIFTTFLRLISLDILDNTIVIILMSIRTICVLVIALLRPYTKYIITLEKLPINDAIKRSVSLSMNNLGLTIKFVLLELALLTRFFINVIVILGVPLLILLIGTTLNIQNYPITKILIYGSATILILGTTYINAIIEAFFATYRYKVYQLIKDKDND